MPHTNLQTKKSVVMHPSKLMPGKANLSPADTAAIIREVHGTLSDELTRYELLSATFIRHQVLAVRFLQTPIDQNGKAIGTRKSTPMFMIAQSSDGWELIGRALA